MPREKDKKINVIWFLCVFKIAFVLDNIRRNQTVLLYFCLGYLVRLIGCQLKLIVSLHVLLFLIIPL